MQRSPVAVEVTYGSAVREYRIENKGVPARVYEPEGAAGLLLFGHRGTHNKDLDHVVALCRRYASGTELTVVCIDAPAHGERRPRSGDPEADGRAVVDAIMGGAEQTAADWHTTADALSSIGPAVALVGFSMGAMAGIVTAGSLPSLRALVLGVAGVPAFAVAGRRPARTTTPHLEAARHLSHVQVLMLNMTDDELMPVEGALELFGAVPGPNKRLMLWEGDHDHMPVDLIECSVAFVRQYAT
jgi:dienelactone hydrolase